MTWSTGLSSAADLGTIASSAAIIVTAFVAYFQLKQAKRLRLEQIRPFVTVSFTPAILLKFEIANIGSVPARDVRVSTSPHLQGNIDFFHVDRISAFGDGIPVLMPGQTLKFNFDQSFNRFNLDSPKENRYEICVEYHDGELDRKFSDSYVLDIGSFEGVSLVPEGIDAIVSELGRMQKSITDWVRKN